jgi:hypothetical protein
MGVEIRHGLPLFSHLSAMIQGVGASLKVFLRHLEIYQSGYHQAWKDASNEITGMFYQFCPLSVKHK